MRSRSYAIKIHSSSRQAKLYTSKKPHDNSEHVFFDKIYACGFSH